MTDPTDRDRLEDLAREVLAVLALQRRYFDGDRSALGACKAAEGELKRRCHEVLDPTPQGRLF